MLPSLTRSSRRCIYIYIYIYIFSVKRSDVLRMSERKDSSWGTFGEGSAGHVGSSCLSSLSPAVPLEFSGFPSFAARSSSFFSLAVRVLAFSSSTTLVDGYLSLPVSLSLVPSGRSTLRHFHLAACLSGAVRSNRGYGASHDDTRRLPRELLGVLAIMVRGHRRQGSFKRPWFLSKTRGWPWLVVLAACYDVGRTLGCQVADEKL